ncbi:synaptic vesicle VAT-1 family membrane protein [Streptacidiphilus rugosus]|uniref:synaptic vesicle VAT-1 family membrane protein n=1 Tax=Streptacidiphilus rugosus TaxID=405783 RepID=UPI0005618DE3|nr:medium chain dehydrogenase/reductase family protein [Streptacidiphilus rugosus]
MKAVWITKAGGPEVLEVRDSPDPQPGPGEVRIKVHAAGVNFADISARMGLYPDAPPPPCVVGYEVAGTVDALGEGVAAPAVGTRVLAMTRFGGQAELVCTPVRQVFQLPPTMTFEHAAALPVNYLTAHHVLFRVGTLHPGDRVLVHMAAGGVGLAVLQLCKTVEDVTVFGTASSSKHDFLRAAGCTYPIDYRTESYAQRVRDLTRGEGVDIVLDPLGGGDWKAGYRLLRPAGRLVAYGFSNTSTGPRRSLPRVARQMLATPLFSPLVLMNANRTVTGVNIGHLWDRHQIISEQLTHLLALYEAKVIEPHIDSTYTFGQAAGAHQRIQDRKNIGKVLLTPN